MTCFLTIIFYVIIRYGVSSAAVAASWGIKLEEGLQTVFPDANLEWVASPYGSLGGIAMMSLCVIILLCGSEMGKTTINIFTMAKVRLQFYSASSSECALCAPLPYSSSYHCASHCSPSRHSFFLPPSSLSFVRAFSAPCSSSSPLHTLCRFLLLLLPSFPFSFIH